MHQWLRQHSMHQWKRQRQFQRNTCRDRECDIESQCVEQTPNNFDHFIRFQASPKYGSRIVPFQPTQNNIQQPSTTTDSPTIPQFYQTPFNPYTHYSTAVSAFGWSGTVGNTTHSSPKARASISTFCNNEYWGHSR